ncbi:chemotaxis protein CheD [Aquitalea sp. FJL05]|uniref:chemotaxis protein CheD n=1 Tax=Aquitalea TaxID=407217 RepID=UPI000F5A2CA0|nr:MULTISPECIES: chemotaxis protein CheD [Aquitalea]RQO76306.1 chemotaxis protein CheD [Aquitalea sp. FJL05]
MTSSPRKEVFLHPGEWLFADREHVISTLLGSCVSIVLWHPQLQVGGMCHYLLAHRNERSSQLSGRYGDEAMLLLLREVLATGRPLQEFRAKLIGGAAILATLEGEHGSNDVAARNADMARLLARQLGLTVQAEDLGGASPRMVVFDVQSGDVWVRLSQDPDTGPTLTGTKRKKT